MTTQSNPGALDSATISEFKEIYESKAAHQLMQNVVTQHDVNDIALNRSIVSEAVHSFSTVLDDWSVTNQARSGRCWMFAGLNLFRAETRHLLNVKDFEFSQSYLMFWGQDGAGQLRPRGNNRDRRPPGRRPGGGLAAAATPGRRRPVGYVRQPGQKARRCPQDGDARDGKLRQFDANERRPQLPGCARDPSTSAASTQRRAGTEAMREAKQESLRAIYRILSIHLGTPPESFDWQWKDRDGEFHRDGAMTPLEFVEKYISTPMEEFVCLVHDPRRANPPGRTYTVQYLGNVVDGTRIKYLNIDIDLMKDIAMRMLQDGLPVWMGCDTGKQMHRDKGTVGRRAV